MMTKNRKNSHNLKAKYSFGQLIKFWLFSTSEARIISGKLSKASQTLKKSFLECFER